MQRRQFLASVGTAGALASVAGCLGGGDSSDDPYVDGKIKFLMSPSEPQDQIRAQYLPIKERLNEHIEAVDTVNIQYASDYAATLSALNSGTGDVAETGPFAGALGVETDNAEILLQRYGYGAWTYSSTIVTREDSDIESLSDLEGKKVGFADALSASGSLYPLGMLKEAGLSVPDEPGSPAGADFDPRWSTHTAAVEALKSGTVAAAGVGYFAATNDERNYQDGIREVAREKGIPRAPVMVSPKLSDDEVEKVKTAFTKASDSLYYGDDGEEGTDDDLWFTDVRPASKEDYKPVIEKARSLGYGADVFKS